MITTITLELVRHGTFHNQLLSPLTPYIALAGNLPAETAYVPVEHAQMLAKLRRLVYSPNHPVPDGSNREAQLFRALSDLREASQVVTRFLESINGLSDAITDAVSGRLNERREPLADGTAPDGIIRLRLIVSANELAMLPFELAQGPLSLGGSEMLSALRPPPVVITRESRRSALHQFALKDADEYRVLVVAADPERLGLPLRGCLLAIYKAFPMLLVDPFSGYGELSVQRARPLGRKERVTVLSAASLEDMAAALAERDFTHVLVLAHGRMPESLDGQPTVVLHSARDSGSVDLVTGDRLAAALCAVRKDDGARHNRPLFVSLMVCDSGNQAQVLFAGGSIAHTLHEAGVPFVVASQFPLTFSGAVLLTEVLFSRLLRNHHPTAAIAEARHRLFTEIGETHDWASLVTYVTLPDDDELDNQVRARKFELLSVTLDQAMNLLDVEGIDNDARDVLLANFRRALRELQQAFDPELEPKDGARRPSTDSDRRGIGTQNASYASYAAVLANACLRNARAHSGPAGFSTSVSRSGVPRTEGLSPADSPVPTVATTVAASSAGAPRGEPIAMSNAIYEALSSALSYYHAHLYFGGRNHEIYAQMTLVLELLTRGLVSAQVARWWYVADWCITEHSLEQPGGGDLMALGTELIHLLISQQIGIDPESIELKARLDAAVDRVIRWRARSPSDALHDGTLLRKRLARCRQVWWGPSSPAMRWLAEVEAKLDEQGVRDLQAT